MSARYGLVATTPLADAVERYLRSETIDNLSHESGVPPRTILAIRKRERGGTAIDVADRLAVAMGTSLDELETNLPDAVVDEGRPGAWTRGEVLERIREWTHQHGKPPAASQWNPARAQSFADAAMAKSRVWLEGIAAFKEGDYPGQDTVERLFGSWSAGLEAAGYASRPKGRTPRAVTASHVRQAVYASPDAAVADFRFQVDCIADAASPAERRQAVQDMVGMALAWLEQLDAEQVAS
ncbi:MAG: hypothetical protein JWM98_1802 [Thermoleophilia bacterium]|nr:hypothetical protein [Thermoleophilia bacterium]